MSSCDLVFVLDGERHFFIVSHVIGRENSPKQVDSDVGCAGRAEDGAEGTQVVVKVAVVEDINKPNENVDV